MAEQGSSVDSSSVVELFRQQRGRAPSVDNLKKQNKNIAILPLPTLLVNYRKKNIYMSVLSLAAGVLFTVTLRTWSAFMICSFMAAYLAVKAFKVEHDYNSGQIVELTAVCTGIRPSFYKDRLTAPFTAESDDGTLAYYKFTVPNKRFQDDFIVGAPYVLYYDREMKNLLIGYVQVGSKDFNSH